MNQGNEVDAVLLRRFKNGSEDAASEIYLRYARKLQTLANCQTNKKHQSQFDDEGIVQSVFRTFFRRANNGQYDVEGTDSLWRLLLVIAMNKIRTRATYLSANKRDVNRSVSLEASLDQTGNRSQDDESLRILEMTIDELLVNMDKDSRRIVLGRIEGFEIGEIATDLGRSKRTVERVLQKFRATLRSQLEIV